MNEDRRIPSSWAMPDDLAKKINNALNRKSITTEENLACAFEEMARDIALIEPDPRDWAGWVELLVEKMEVEAEKRRKRVEFNKMVEFLKNQIGQ